MIIFFNHNFENRREVFFLAPLRFAASSSEITNNFPVLITPIDRKFALISVR